MKKKITIAVTGHRDMIETEAIDLEVNNYLRQLVHDNKDKEIVLLSPLADGADRYVAERFLALKSEHENLKLVVPMPFGQERYEEDFDEASKEEFLDFWVKSESVFAVKRVSANGYVDVGRYIVDESDILLALWDGTFTGKLGGTGEVVEYARTMKKEIVHIVCERKS